MKRFIKITAIAALPFLLLGASGSRSPDGPVTFTIDKVDYDSPGGWWASGAIQDSGTCCVDAPHLPKGISGAFRVVDDLTGQQGTLTWELDAQFIARPLGNGERTVQGAWRITGGTGLYQGSSGQGRVSGTFVPRTGEMHVVHSGTIALDE